MKLSYTINTFPITNTLYGIELFCGDKPLRIWGLAMSIALECVLDVLAQNGYKATDLKNKKLTIGEEHGVRLGLVFMAVKPLQRLDRIEYIIGYIRNMAIEEVYYWYAKCNNSSSARRAIRILAGGS